MTTDTNETTVAAHFSNALLANDWAAMRELLADDVTFRALLPRSVVEVATADEAVETMSGWFDSDESVSRVEAVETESFSVKQRATYRFQTEVSGSEESFRVEQHAFLTLNDEGEVQKADLVCSGWVPRS